jgi:hypothetical protein
MLALSGVPVEVMARILTLPLERRAVTMQAPAAPQSPARRASA